jgi:trehalose 6-phosphate phosphatase
VTILVSIEKALIDAREALQCSPSGLFTDVDGTISPIVVNPADARVPEPVRRALRRLRDQIDTVSVVSGRAATDARQMVRVAGIGYVGNHGLEHLVGRRRVVDPAAAAFIPTVKRCAEDLHPLNQNQGIVVEDKLATATIHYRTAPDRDIARRRIYQAIRECASCRDLQVEDGRQVVNLLPPVKLDKGSAVLRLATQRQLRGIVYLGDDVTDIDAFRALRELRTRGVKTAAIAAESSESPAELLSAADAVVPGVYGVVELLDRLSVEELGVSEIGHQQR